MLLYKALQIEDEYQRLQLLSEGIRQITTEMPKVNTIQNPQLVKFLLCAYPFQSQNVDMLIMAFFDYYQNEEFFWSFTQAIFAIGEYQESKIINSKKQSIFDVLLQKQKEVKAGQNHFYHFADSVLLQMNNIKMYVCQCLPMYFSMAKKLEIDQSRLYDLYRVYLHNANQKELMFKLIESFEKLKLQYFVNEPWLDNFQAEINLYKQNLIPQKLVNRLKSQNLQLVYEQFRSQQIDSNQTPLSEDPSPQIDRDAIIKQQVDQYQKMLCSQRSVNLIDESVDLYRMLKFIIYPTKYDLIDDWNDKFGDVNIDKISKGLKNSDLSDLHIVRSYKALNSMLVCPKMELLKLKVQNFLPKLFRQVHKTLSNEDRNVNLYHLAALLNKLLELCGKQSIYQIIKLDLLFILTQYFENEEILSIVQEILDIDVDKYKLGYFVQEQVWSYILCMEWFDYLFKFIYKNKLGTKHQNDEKKTQILGMLQSMNRNYRGSIKSDILLNQSYFSKSMNSKDNLKDVAQEDLLNGKDIDNIKFFMKEKANFDPQIIEELIRQQNLSPKIQKPLKRISQVQPQVIEIPNKKKQLSLPKINNLKSPGKSVNSPLSRDSSKMLSVDMDMNLSIMSKLSSSSTQRQDNSDDVLSSNKQNRINLTGKGNASLFKQQSNLIKEIDFIGSIQFIYWIINSLYQHQKRFQTQKECNIAEKLSKLISSDHLNQLYSIYIKKIKYDDYGMISGQIINLIFECVLYFKLEQFYESLNEYFFQNIEGLSHQLVSQTNLLRKSLLIKTYFNGFFLNQEIGQNYLEQNIYKFITLKTFNIFSQQFLLPNANNVYLLDFSNFIRCLFSRAPAYLLQQILFNYGLLSIINESQRVNIQNCIDNIQSNSYYFSMQIVKTIHDLLIKRNMNIILDNLKPLDLWDKLCKATEHIAIQAIQKDQINEFGEIRKIDKRKLKYKKLQTVEKYQTEEAMCYTPDLTHRNLKNMKIRKHYDL